MIWKQYVKHYQASVWIGRNKYNELISFRYVSYWFCQYRSVPHLEKMRTLSQRGNKRDKGIIQNYYYNYTQLTGFYEELVIEQRGEVGDFRENRHRLLVLTIHHKCLAVVEAERVVVVKKLLQILFSFSNSWEKTSKTFTLHYCTYSSIFDRVVVTR